MKKLSVIIVSYHDAELLKNCLLSIEKYNDIGEELEVIVSDNAADNELNELMKSDFSWVKYIQNPDNLGFGYGNNRGADIATGKYYLFLNPDTLLVEPVFRYAVNKFEEQENLALFGLKQMTNNYSSNYSFYLLDGIGFLDVLRQRYYLKNDKFIDGKMFIAGSDMFIRRDVFEKIGKFDENLFMFFEESDITRRIKQLDCSLHTGYYPEKKIIHLVGGSRKQMAASFSSEKHVLDSMKYYCGKFDISFSKMAGKYIRLSYLRKIKYQIIGNQEQVKEFDKIIHYAKSLKKS